jgi:hypothetical protein
VDEVRSIVSGAHEIVSRFEIAINDPVLMGRDVGSAAIESAI